ncbi:transporter substrate-binding domain-containing protein [Lutimaribacter saemankumensis]|uniref:ABC-type amino acid transport substrate-binding protein n=1 Tax=Lutimaribacter saemankumensis TaxID=490829 RepID=A0A1G8TEU4_9RHOB|nr:transporter substrate-binding domain-containing protein [Lutimaribacter saemankumensis]SDJ40031.1 ABC-type amino acid transport substrate-binding protein [Lutimaribacter saemankumensis]
MKTYVIALSCLLAFPVQAFAQGIVIGTADAYEAGDYTVDPSALQSFDKAFGELLCRRGKFDCDWKTMGREELVPALQTKKIDVILAAIPMTEALGDGIEKTAAYLYPDPFAIVGLPGFVPFGNVKTVAAILDPAIEVWHAASGYNIIYFPTLEEALQEVVKGGAEIAFGEYDVLAPLVDAAEGRLEVLNPGRHLRPGLTMALRSESVDLRFALEDLIYDMSKDGTLNTLNKEWFGKDAMVWE